MNTLTTDPETAAPRPPRFVPESLASLWTHRELLRQLAARNLLVRYQRSVLGFLWALLNPLLTVVILVLVFSRIIRIGVPGYWAFLASGYFAWSFTVSTLIAATGVMQEHAALSKTARFPSEVLLFAGVLSRLVEFAIEMSLVLVALALFWHHGVPLAYLMLPVVIALHTLLMAGLALPVATLSVFFLDVGHGLPVILLMLGYLSPVFYPLSLVPPSARAIFLLNPFSVLLSAYHDVLYEGRLPSLATMAAIAVTAVVAFVAGYAIFRRQRALFAEIV